MTRFKKEMVKRFPHVKWNDDGGEIFTYVIEEKALIVFCHPAIITVLQFLHNGKQREVTDEYPEISHPYLVHLCGGDVDAAKKILAANHF